MKKITRSVAAAAVFATAALGMAGTAVAAEGQGYVPDSCTEVVNGVETAVSCTEVDPAVESAVESATAVQPATAVQSSTAGSLPYTGNNSSIVLAEVGVGLLAVGGGVLLVVKRRQSADAA